MPTAARVAERTAGLCLDASGALPDNDHLQMAVRGGVLVDLVLADRLAQADDSIELDAAPTGWYPGDRALGELGALLDGQSLDWWLQRSRLGLADLAAVLLQEEAWRALPRRALRRPRYAVADTAGLERDRALLRRAGAPAGPDDAAVVCIAAAAGLGGPRASGRVDDLLDRAGDLRWVCELVVDLISRARAEGTAVGRASQSTLWIP